MCAVAMSGLRAILARAWYAPSFRSHHHSYCYSYYLWHGVFPLVSRLRSLTVREIMADDDETARVEEYIQLFVANTSDTEKS